MTHPMNAAAGRTLYIEEAVMRNPTTQRIVEQFAGDCIIYCDSYREVFNPKNKHFRMQKETMSLILAHKPKNFIQPSPYGIGGRRNYYFSHILNCIYDCKYCFLQGLYSSAMLVLFVNYEDFFAEIDKTLEEHPNDEVCFFSGYDSDSLAYEPITCFVSAALPFFATRPRAILELRTKSVQIKSLLSIKTIPNCVVAFSLAPASIVAAYEAKTPSLIKRLAAMQKLAAAGWQIGIRLDPMMPTKNWQADYAELIQRIGERLPSGNMHSITLGVLRFPMFVYKNMRKLYPTEQWLVDNIVTDKQQFVTFDAKHADEMMAFCRERLSVYYPPDKIIQMRANQ